MENVKKINEAPAWDTAMRERAKKPTGENTANDEARAIMIEKAETEELENAAARVIPSGKLLGIFC
jgi:hypothetical protein